MAMRIATGPQNAACDAVVDLIDAGAPVSTVEIRSGLQPASANDVDAGTLLATFDLPDPAFGAAVAGVATANAITDVTGDAAGTAAHFRVKDGAGATIEDGSVTATGGGGDMELNTVEVSVGVNLSVTSWTVTMPAG